MDKIKLIFKSAGIKHGTLPEAHFLVDCRGVLERQAQKDALPGENHGNSVFFQDTIEKWNKDQLQTIEDFVLDAIMAIPSRRSEKKDPYEDPFVILFFCAHGIHRSVSTKNIMAKRLKGYGYDVEVQ